MYSRRFTARGQRENVVQPEDLLEDGIYELGLEERLAGDTRLMEYITELMNWNRIYNLTSVRKPTEIVTRHILDSLSILPYLGGRRVLDVGTGAGLPGIPLAIACPEREFVLLDSSSKKLRFVQQTLAILQLDNVTLEHTRIEDYQPQERFDSVMCRAFSELRELYRHAARLCTDTGRILAMKGIYPVAEIESLENRKVIEKVVSLTIPGLDAERHLVCMHRAPAGG
jgi:16S rRNA (guanine527-N7)-methyltransferase